MSLAPGATLGPYEILAPLGAGGMGEVYRARDTKLNREVAIKMLPEAREAVSHVWLVDPLVQTLEVLRLDAGRWTIVSTWAGVDVVRAEPFDALELDLTWLWDEPPPDAGE